MAEKAEIMNSQKYPLPLGSFTLEIDLDIDASVRFTRELGHHGSDFLFAVAELWVVTGNGCDLIFPKTTPGNFFEDLSAIKKMVVNPPVIKNIEGIISCGNWCSWMENYWNRLNDEVLTSEDEKNYQLLICASAVESRVGHLAIYKYGEISVIEASTRSSKSVRHQHVSASFDTGTLHHDIVSITSAMRATLKEAMS